MTKNEWNLISVAIKSLLDERNQLTIDKDTEITDIKDLRREMRSWDLEELLSGTIVLTGNALIDTVEGMVEAHRLAANIEVREPNAKEIKKIKEDLKEVSASLSSTTRLAALGNFLSQLAPLINEVTS